MSDYKLSASLEGHEDDVRAVGFPSPNVVLSASRDTTVRTWTLVSSNPPKYDDLISSQGSAFINAVTYLPPTKEFPDGLIISGGKDTIIEVRQPGKPPEQSPEALLLGHGHNVCALNTNAEVDFVVSGSWDGTARVWGIEKWECETLLEGHGGSVWAVLAYDSKLIITGCADKSVRIFDRSGKLLHTLKGSTDVVRALCHVPASHPSKADFASAGNDAVIRLWRLSGQQVCELHGHENFIYAITSLPTGELVSSGEDRTVRIWQGNQCIQTITHPAISVWGVAACAQNGDIVSGASDRKVRVFSRAIERKADKDVIQAFEESVKASAIPQQQVGNIVKEKLPGPEFLEQKSGTKEGQNVLIQEPDGSISAHQWSQGAQQWINVGTVVDAVGSSGKKIDYLGKAYDFVFDVDIEDGKPALKLPYNLSQNPYEVATKFIQENELPITYLDAVAKFITENTKGAMIGQSSEAQVQGADPWGSGDRYRPGESSSGSSAPPAALARPKILPQTAYLSIKTANLKTIRKKIEEINSRLIEDGAKDLSINAPQLELIEQILSESAQTTETIRKGIKLIVHIATEWPPADRLPGLDLLRLLTAASPELASYSTSSGQNLIAILAKSGVFEDKDRVNNIMLATRTFSNLFETAKGRHLAESEFDQIHTLVKHASSGENLENRNLVIAVTTLYLNYSVLFTSTPYSGLPSSIDRGLLLLDSLATILERSTDSEAIYRGLVAVGTLVGLGEELQMAAKDVYDVPALLAKAEKVSKEPRIKAIVAEVKALLNETIRSWD